jgi:antitoxin component YwqK of YwqJK toxin-antitoxin module
MTEHINQTGSEGRLHGVWKWYYSDGTLGLREHYMHGKAHGLWERYRQAGTIYFKVYHITIK